MEQQEDNPNPRTTPPNPTPTPTLKKGKMSIITLGDSAVGKTSILSVYQSGFFSDTQISTIGIDFITKHKTIDDHKLTIRLYDTAGQAQFHYVGPHLLKTTDGIILVYSVENRESFESIFRRKEEIETNYKTLSSIILVANKIDLDQSEWKVSTEEGKEAAEKMNIPFFEVSAKENTNLDEMFDYIINDVYQKKRSVMVKEDENKKKEGTNTDEPNKLKELNVVSDNNNNINEEIKDTMDYNDIKGMSEEKENETQNENNGNQRKSGFCLSCVIS